MIDWYLDLPHWAHAATIGAGVVVYVVLMVANSVEAYDPHDDT